MNCLDRPKIYSLKNCDRSSAFRRGWILEPRFQFAFPRLRFYTKLTLINKSKLQKELHINFADK
ncbi:hypothetical protein NIES592_02150 [Fischerella major NIES-592]|uniref:Uncharacterized protein n=2 Tax=Fischerella TaxID=1190 RepID=A0A1U7H5B3_9CYAN|nr:hypothetical protein NIES592_02150 [Fischerella major NIES-592]PMB46169.1 hypothetical protein CEN41_06545 [Fischerella thermalis CCMEE 5330]